MSHRFEDEDEEEDELQRILEGRDVDVEDDYDSGGEVNYDKQSINNDYNYNNKHKRGLNKRSLETNSRHSSKNITKETQKFTKKRVANEENDYESENDLHLSEDNEDNEMQTNSGVNDQKSDEMESKLKVKVRRIVSRPQLKLNADKLMTKSGIVELPKVFANMKFKGRGHELSDLNKILFKLEHWSHRLFPSLTFEDFIEKVEQLGDKRPVKTFIKKIRYDLPLNLDPEEEVVVNQSDDEEMPKENNDHFGADHDFDAIIGKYQNQQNGSQHLSALTDTEVTVKEPQIHASNIDKEVDIEMTDSKEQMNDLMSEDEVIRQLNSNDIQVD